MVDTINALAASMTAAVFNEAGVTATYTPSGGSPISITVVVENRIEDELTTFERSVYEHQVRICFDLAEAPNVAKDDTVLVGATTYTLTELVETDGFSTWANAKD